MTGRSTALVRAWGAAAAVAGAAMAARPADIAAAAGGQGCRPPDPIVRILGIRYLLQGAVLIGTQGRRIVIAAVAADTAHAASMMAVAATRPRYRRPALVSAGLATMSAGTGTLALLRHHR